MKLNTVFVYGTLKRGYGNHRLLATSHFVGDAVTVEKYRMIDAGFPVVLDGSREHNVAGEIYQCDDATLRRLDALEGEGHMYDRKLIDVRLCPDANGYRHVVKAFIYIGCNFWKQRVNIVWDATDPAGNLCWRC
jgi:gamma-glutamylaminecyclotransferase